MAYFREQLKPGMTKKTSTPKRNARPSFKIVDEEGNPAPDVVREKARKNRIAYPIKDKKQLIKRKKYNIGGRANLLEEMGRIDARRHPDRADRAEKRRVIRELNKGYKSGGAVLKGKKVGCQIK